MTLLLKNDEIIPLIGMRDSLNILEQAYRDYGQGKILNVPWSLFHVPAGKPDHFYRLFELRASMSEVGISALRVISTVIQEIGTSSQVVPTAHGKRVDQVFLFDQGTGEMIAILAGDHIQLLRVAATSALGAKYLANPGGDTYGIIGSGAQADAQLEAMALARDLKRVLVYSRSPENRERFALNMQTRYPNLLIKAVDSPQSVISQSHIITSATTSSVPTFDGSDVRPGSHVNTLTPGQVDDSILARASIFMSNKGHVLEYLVHGQHRVYLGETDFYKHWDEIRELELVMLGEIPARRSEDEITVFLGEGAGLQFASLGYEVFKRAQAKGIGRDLPTDWFMST